MAVPRFVTGAFLGALAGFFLVVAFFVVFLAALAGFFGAGSLEAAFLTATLGAGAGFSAAFAVGIIYSYRGQLQDKVYLLYGFGGLFIMGLGLRLLAI